MLEPGKSYLLKWSNFNEIKQQVHNMVVLKGQFIKYFDRSYCEQLINYIRNEDEDADPPHELMGTILTERDEYIEYIQRPFEDPLYPYSTRGAYGHFNFSCNIGLFKIISIVNSVFRGVQGSHYNNNPSEFVTLRSNTLINTPRIVYNETLMWVNLDSRDFSIVPAIDKLKLLQEKAVDTYDIPSSIKKYEINSYLGGKKKKTTKIKKNKKKIKKTSKKR